MTIDVEESKINPVKVVWHIELTLDEVKLLDDITHDKAHEEGLTSVLYEGDRTAVPAGSLRSKVIDLVSVCKNLSAWRTV